MSATALLLGLAAIGFAALPVPVDPLERESLGRALQLSPETTQARASRKKPEPPAGLDLAALPKGATTREVDRSAPAAAPARPPVSKKEFELPLTHRLAVKVVDTTGRSLSGARLSWSRIDDEPVGKGRCDANGSFESEDLEAGSYRLQVETADFSRKTTVELVIPRRVGEVQRVVLSALP